MSFKDFVSRTAQSVASLFDPADRRQRSGDWSHSRGPLIDDDRVMQSHTHVWLRHIPSGQHPKHLCRHYPRIANRIAVSWEQLPVVDRLLTELMIDRRGGRQGFSPRIRLELERLYSLHARRMTPTLRGRMGSHAASLKQPGIPEALRRVRVHGPLPSIKR